MIICRGRGGSEQIGRDDGDQEGVVADRGVECIRNTRAGRGERSCRWDNEVEER